MKKISFYLSGIMMVLLVPFTPSGEKTSFVTKGSLGLVAANSLKAEVKEENIRDASEIAQKIQDVEEAIKKTPSSFDRSMGPGAI
jgi:hypothetical protein